MTATALADVVDLFRRLTPVATKWSTLTLYFVLWKYYVTFTLLISNTLLNWYKTDNNKELIESQCSDSNGGPLGPKPSILTN